MYCELRRTDPPSRQRYRPTATETEESGYETRTYEGQTERQPVATLLAFWVDFIYLLKGWVDHTVGLDAVARRHIVSLPLPMQVANNQTCRPVNAM
jgi:hypothetical protein